MNDVSTANNVPPLIDAGGLQALLQQASPRTVLLDVGFDLTDPEAGRRAHAQAHLPGALYLHLDHDLSAPKTGANGRHPLPTREAFAARLGALGLRGDDRIVVYDAAGGAYASRAWWMLRWIGHAAVQVLDGGLRAWRAAGGTLEAGPVGAWPPADFPLRSELTGLIEFPALRAGLGQGRRLVVDGRAADRFRGENETLDPVAGHIPGALNRPFRDNLGSDGRFKPAEQLRGEWQALMAGRGPGDLVQQCGSGVTACHNLLAMAQAGLPGALLYPGSWSEWCAQPGAPIARG